jgi:hypothetical protein
VTRGAGPRAQAPLKGETHTQSGITIIFSKSSIITIINSRIGRYSIECHYVMIIQWLSLPYTRSIKCVTSFLLRTIGEYTIGWNAAYVLCCSHPTEHHRFPRINRKKKYFTKDYKALKKNNRYKLKEVRTIEGAKEIRTIEKLKVEYYTKDYPI